MNKRYDWVCDYCDAKCTVTTGYYYTKPKICFFTYGMISNYPSFVNWRLEGKKSVKQKVNRESPTEIINLKGHVKYLRRVINYYTDKIKKALILERQGCNDGWDEIKKIAEQIEMGDGLISIDQ